MEKTIEEIKQDLSLVLRDEITLRHRNTNYASQTIPKTTFLEYEVNYIKGISNYDTVEDFLDSVTVGLIYNNINSRIDYEEGKLTIYSDYLNINIKKYEKLNVNMYGLLITLAMDEANHTHLFIDQFASALFNYCHTIPEINLMYEFLEDIGRVGLVGKKMRNLLFGLVLDYRNKLVSDLSRDEQRDSFETEINKIRKKTKNIEKYSKQVQ
jgi:hypothetical protein